MGRKAGTRDARRAAVRPRWPSGAAAHAVGEDRGSARTQLLDRMNGGPRAERVASLAKALDRDRRDVLPKGGWPYPVPIDHPWFVLLAARSVAVYEEHGPAARSLAGELAELLDKQRGERLRLLAKPFPNRPRSSYRTLAAEAARLDTGEERIFTDGLLLDIYIAIYEEQTKALERELLNLAASASINEPMARRGGPAPNDALGRAASGVAFLLTALSDRGTTTWPHVVAVLERRGWDLGSHPDVYRAESVEEAARRYRKRVAAHRERPAEARRR